MQHPSFQHANLTCRLCARTDRIMESRTLLSSLQIADQKGQRGESDGILFIRRRYLSYADDLFAVAVDPSVMLDAA